MAAARVQSRSLSCPNCGSPVRLRGFAHTLSAVCESCRTILDTSDPNVARIVQAQSMEPVEKTIPHGERCKIDGFDWQVLGFQQRAIFVEGQRYAWQEYVLFQPYKGFRYLTDYQGHWNFVRPLQVLPDESGFRGVEFNQQRYKAFQVAEATTAVVLGEFPWRVKAGEQASVHDFVRPPFALSKEVTGNEINWSHSRYVGAVEIQQAFGGRVNFPPSTGVYSNQPNPHEGKPGRYWMTFLLFLLGLLGLFSLFLAIHREKEVFAHSGTFRPAQVSEQSFVTKMFDISGWLSTAVKVDIDSDVNQNWSSFAIALINEETGVAYDFGKAVSYYYGSEEGESWVEGSQKASETIPSVKPGRYYLRVEPDRELQAGEDAQLLQRPVNYSISVKQDTGIFWPYPVALVLLLIPPIVASLRYSGFESKRWAESDFASSSSTSDSDSDGSGDSGSSDD